MAPMERGVEEHAMLAEEARDHLVFLVAELAEEALNVLEEAELGAMSAKGEGADQAEQDMPVCVGGQSLQNARSLVVEIGADLAVAAHRLSQALSGDQDVPLHPVALQVDDRRLENSFGVFAPGVEAQRRADPGVAGGLMDVSVERQQGPRLLDRRPHRGASHRLHEHMAAAVDDLQVVIELRADVDAGIARGGVSVYGGPPRRR